MHFSEPLTTVIGPITQLIAYPAAQPNTQPAPCIRLPEQLESFRRSSRIATKPAVKPSRQPIKKPTIKFATEPTTKLTVQLNSPPAQPGKRGRKITYPLKNFFSWNRCFELSQRYKLAVYQNRKEGPEAQSKAVKAVFFHEQDYPEATVEERQEFHQFCGTWCQFKAWELLKKPLIDFAKVKKYIHGDEVVWEGGLLARFEIDHRDAYNELFRVFQTLGNTELMSRCSKALTQNVNESTHSKLWKHCLKIKKHKKARYLFCARHVILVHNFGHEAASLHHVLGTMSKSMKNTLKYDDSVTACC